MGTAASRQPEQVPNRRGTPLSSGVLRLAHMRRYSEIAATLVRYGFVDVVQALLVLALLIPPAVLFVRDRRRAIAAAHAAT